MSLETAHLSIPWTPAEGGAGAGLARLHTAGRSARQTEGGEVRAARVAGLGRGTGAVYRSAPSAQPPAHTDWQSEAGGITNVATDCRF